MNETNFEGSHPSIDAGNRSNKLRLNTQDILGMITRGNWYPAEELETLIAFKQ